MIQSISFLSFIRLSFGRLSMCFAEIGEYANEGYTVFCENIHTVIACWCFILFDFFFIFAQFGLFFLLPEKHSERHMAEWALLGWMSLSALIFVTGPIGLGYEKSRFFCIYKWRVFLSMFRALAAVSFYAWRFHIILCAMWLYGFVTYAIGFHVCRYTHHYIKDHYRIPKESPKQSSPIPSGKEDSKKKKK
ncbi:hypothetical protein PRIPAC_87781 [Pristionchus pacificus]|uniref:Uncharacterized protein n=1 Tax=Pristionchus pacificus TaxID=54126 RepID=A0A2A6CZ44_PRIPA|nr:hypothetical protein PRIPAC_87781 [Pristionchus pacificus]|eukprot:PDM83301.1 hypothetical protein PRIPAC_34933 [Pristionchus pacificus]